MEALKGQSAIVTIFAFLLTVCADPDCKLFDEREVVCIADIEDYVLRKGLFSEYSQATRVTLRNCRITDMEFGAFENNYYVQYIDLSANKISSLKLGVLDSNGQVTHLNLSYNILTTFPSGLFNQKPNLEVLDLRANRINSLPADIFIPLRKLVHLDLSYNDFLGKDLSPFIFGKNRKIKIIDLSRNDMSDSPESLLSAFLELDFLNLERCSLKDVPLFATKANLKTMKHLVLSSNQITNIVEARKFMYLEKLETLNLAENLIDNVAANTFTYLKNLQVIILRNNRLKFLPDGLFRNLNRLGTVDLSHNFLEGVPLNAFRNTALKVLNLANNRLSYLDAYFSVQLRNYGITISKFYFQNNPWQCACLNDVLNEMKYYGIEYNAAKYNGKYPVCVTTTVFICKRNIHDHQLFVEMYDNEIMGLVLSNNIYTNI